jgi:hypothetical protein
MIAQFCLLGIFGPVIASWFIEQNAPGRQNDVGSLENRNPPKWL